MKHIRKFQHRLSTKQYELHLEKWGWISIYPDHPHYLKREIHMTYGPPADILKDDIQAAKPNVPNPGFLAKILKLNIDEIRKIYNR